MLFKRIGDIYIQVYYTLGNNIILDKNRKARPPRSVAFPVKATQAYFHHVHPDRIISGINGENAGPAIISLAYRSSRAHPFPYPLLLCAFPPAVDERANLVLVLVLGFRDLHKT